MELIRFEASKVYDYLNFKMSFNRQLNFLVGVNGSGKTTALRLIHALLTPSIQDIIEIPFQRVLIKIKEENTDIVIQAFKDEKHLEIGISTHPEKLEIPLIADGNMKYFLAKARRGDAMYENLQFESLKHEVFNKISKLNAPVFLGIDRRYRIDNEIKRRILLDKESYSNSPSMFDNLHNKRIIEGSLGAGLNETQFLIKEAYRKLRRIQDKLSEKLQESILVSAFKYVDFSIEENSMTSMLNPSDYEKSKILNRRKEIESALSAINLPVKKKISENINSFFDKISELLEITSASSKLIENKQSFLIEWLLNKAQIDRIIDLIEVIDSHKSRVDKLFTPINTFLDNINYFYEDTKKTVSIDTVGQLIITRTDGESTTIEALSSGERQILIIMAHLLFNKYGERSNVFIIDEPELSLHLKWQENFVDKAMNVNSNSQLILATHSPEIIGIHKEYCISL